jgi:hypothetical protein
MKVWKLVAFVAVCAAAACAESPGSDSDDDGGGSSSSSSSGSGGEGAGVPICNGVGFESVALSWSLPDYGVDADGQSVFRYVAEDPLCFGEGRIRYQLLDLVGDTLPDMVVTENCATDPGTGATHWRVHENLGTGLSPDASGFGLPDYGVDADGQSVFRYLAEDPLCAGTGRIRYQVLDLLGDSKPDLVVTENCGADPATGSTQWRVHENVGGGFAAEATSFALPNYGTDADGQSVFRYLAEDPLCLAGGRFRYQVVDMVGDSRPDLVVTEHCTDDAATGSTQWRVHENDGNGFAAEPMLFALPSYGIDADGQSVFRYLAEDPICLNMGRLRYQLVDLLGDGKPDLVVTENCAADPATGSAQWRVHENGGSGFAAEPTLFTLPSYGADADGSSMLRYVAEDPICLAGGRRRFQTMDLTADGKPDLVVTENCTDDPATGAAHWRVHPNTGTGFSAEPIYWPLPEYGVDSDGQSVLRYVSEDPICAAGGRLRYQTLGLGTLNATDLVVSEHCDTDPAVGATSWLVHTVICE